MILGLVLAGGQASRFGSDKALAQLNGRTLLALAVDRMAQWCEQVVIVGRETGPAPCLPDWPNANMGPLGGIAAALRHAQDAGYDAVLSCGVDSLDLPADLPALLSPAPAFLESQPVVGLWSISATAALEAILAGNGSHSMRRFAGAIGARDVAASHPPANINTPEDLAAAQAARQNPT